MDRVIDGLELRRLSDTRFKDRIFRLCWIQDIFTKPSRNYYKVLFQDVNSPMYLRESIFPEHLSYYTIGSCYKNCILYNKRPAIGETIPIEIESTENNLIKRISDVITDDDYNLSNFFTADSGKKIDFTSENKRQYGIVFETDKQIIIFPCAVIGATYYFTSSSIRKQIFVGNLSGLYEKPIDIDDEIKAARIIMKPGTANEHAKNIVRFEKNDFAEKRWRAIKNHLLEEKRELETRSGESSFVPLKIDIPVKQNIFMDVRALTIPGNMNTKEKILVFEIKKEYSRYDFKYLIRLRRKQSDATSVEKEIIPTSAKETSSMLINEPPSSNLSTVTIIHNIEEKNTNVEDVEGFDLSIEAKDSTIRPLREILKEYVDKSLIQSELHGEESVRPGSIEQSHKESQNAEDKSAFTLENFRCMIEMLKSQTDVVNLQIHEAQLIPARHESTQKFSLREAYNKVTKQRREYLHVTFRYLNLSVCLIEIDQTALPNGCATYGLVVEGDYKFTQNRIEDVLNAYVNNKQVKTISQKIKSHGFKFLSKHHPAKKEESYYKRWCEELLRKVII